MLDYTHTQSLCPPLEVVSASLLVGDKYQPWRSVNSHPLWNGWNVGRRTVECLRMESFIHPQLLKDTSFVWQTESNISNPQNNSNLKQLDRDDRNVCQLSRVLCPLPYSSVDLQHIYNRRLLVHLQHLLHLAVWLQQHLANTTRITSCTIVSKIQAVETKKTIRTWRILHDEGYRRQKKEKKWVVGGWQVGATGGGHNSVENIWGDKF